MQLRQTQAIALSDAYQARASSTIDQNLAAIGSPEFLSGTAKVYANDIGDLTPEEYIALEYQMAATMSSLENLHFQYESGFLSDEHWQKNRRDMECAFTHPFYRSLIVGWAYRESFMTVVKDTIEKVSTEPSDCWNATIESELFD